MFLLALGHKIQEKPGAPCNATTSEGTEIYLGGEDKRMWKEINLEKLPRVKTETFWASQETVIVLQLISVNP